MGALRLSLTARRRLLPWLFLGPGLLWLLVFFAYPLVNQAGVSLMTGDPEPYPNTSAEVPMLVRVGGLGSLSWKVSSDKLSKPPQPTPG